MSLPKSEDTTDDAGVTPGTSIKPKEWVKFEEEPPVASSTPKKLDNVKDEINLPNSSKSDSVTVDISNINKNVNEQNTDDYKGAVISTKSVQINLDRSSLSRSMTSEIPEPQLPSNETSPYNPKSASLKTIDLRDPANGRNIISTSIGNIRQGFANGDTIVTLLPVNTKWPWITPAKFRPELVPEELMAQGLTVSILKISQF